ncbi:MAG TPA: hypothetical protein VF573_22280 [Paraburkholderia sp.]|uniref:hypothetical protein n=1 Tax=Paraburkholderia sp. TaxID=1926495 RepID=UPI002ED5DFBC
MGIVIELAAFRRAKAVPPHALVTAKAPPAPASRRRRPTSAAQREKKWDALKCSSRHKPGAPMSVRRRDAVRALLQFEFPTTIVVDDDGREFISDFVEHERAREYFWLFGFDIDEFENADAMYAHWLRLDMFAGFVQLYLDSPPRFCETFACGMPDVWVRYVSAIARQDRAKAASLSYVLDLDPVTRPKQEDRCA